MLRLLSVIIFFISINSCTVGIKERPVVSIQGNKFFLNKKPLYEGHEYLGNSIEGLLLNARMVQAIFDDLNPETRKLWQYPDTKNWDANRNTNEFVQAMSQWKAHGLAAISLNLQGGSPTGYGNKQWINSAYNPEGDIYPAYFKRLKQVLDEAEKLNMVVILGLFYFGQDQYLVDETAILNAVDQTIDWLHHNKYRHVVIEISNESNLTPALITNYFTGEIEKLGSVAGSQDSIDNYKKQLEHIETMSYQHDILSDKRVHELILHVKNQVVDGRRYLVSTSFAGSTVPNSSVVSVSDFILLHGNNVESAEHFQSMIDEVRAMEAYVGQPIVFNEDDHYDYHKKNNHFLTAIKSGVGWGYFDYRRNGEDFHEGYQSVPVDWLIRSQRKKDFFNYLREITGAIGEL